MVDSETIETSRDDARFQTFWRSSARVCGRRQGAEPDFGGRLLISLTGACNLRCPSCCAHSNMPALPHVAQNEITLGQVRHFVESTRRRGLVFSRITLTGGEPLLHPQFSEIVRLVHTLIPDHCRFKKVRIVSNSLLPAPADVLPLLYRRRRDALDSRNELHHAFWMAPRDMADAPLRRQCRVPLDCGYFLTKWGFYPCAPGGAIMLLRGIGGLMEFPESRPLWIRNHAPCDWCAFALRYPPAAPEDRITESFSTALHDAHRRPFDLPLYPEE